MGGGLREMTCSGGRRLAMHDADADADAATIIPAAD